MIDTNPLSGIRLIGMIHLLPLPGAPGYRGSRNEILERALHDAHCLVAAGFDAVLIENFGDIPFTKDDAGRHVVADMTYLVTAIGRECRLPLGVQVLRNDARASLAIAAATDAAFIRVNVHSGAMVADQGVIEGAAADTLRYRRAIDADAVAILADVHVKHATPLGVGTFEEALRDTVTRGLADAVVITGSGTGHATDPERVRSATRHTLAPVYVGSGVDTISLHLFFPFAHGVIVGTSIKRDGSASGPVDPERALRFVESARDLLA